MVFIKLYSILLCLECAFFFSPLLTFEYYALFLFITLIFFLYRSSTLQWIQYKLRFLFFFDFFYLFFFIGGREEYCYVNVLLLDCSGCNLHWYWFCLRSFTSFFLGGGGFCQGYVLPCSGCSPHCWVVVQVWYCCWLTRIR